MLRLYFRILRDMAAMRILAALVSSPQRYQYIAEQVESGRLTNKAATEKNIVKSILMADQFIEILKAKNKLDKHSTANKAT